jgi:glutamine amidotransferase
MIAVIDYGAGNLSSVSKAIAKLGLSSSITSDPDVVRSSEILVLPGVGASGDAMLRLTQLGLQDAIRDSIARGVPFLGICLGLQILLDVSEESGGQSCLGVIPGAVRLLPKGPKVPHMGWNQVSQMFSHPVFGGIPDGSDFYFVHSYYPDPKNERLVAGRTSYGVTFCSVVASDNVIATQFHPEKSGTQGLHLLANFFRFAGERKLATSPHIV